MCQVCIDSFVLYKVKNDVRPHSIVLKISMNNSSAIGLMVMMWAANK